MDFFIGGSVAIAVVFSGICGSVEVELVVGMSLGGSRDVTWGNQKEKVYDPQDKEFLLHQKMISS